METMGKSVDPDWGELVRRSVAGDEVAWNELLRRTYSPVLDYLGYLAHDPDVAQDLTQSLFLRLLENDFRRLRGYDPSLGVPLPAYFCVIAYRMYLDYARSGYARERDRATDIAGLEHILTAPPEAEYRLAERELRTRVDGLPAQQRTAVLLRERGLSYEEIARVMGIGSGGVGALLSRARERLSALDPGLAGAPSPQKRRKKPGD